MNNTPASKHTTSGQTFNLHRTELAAMLHEHKDVARIDIAALFKTGELDVDLIERAQLFVSDAIKRNPIVSVEFAAITLNIANQRKEPVFGVRADGVFRATTVQVRSERSRCSLALKGASLSLIAPTI